MNSTREASLLAYGPRRVEEGEPSQQLRVFETRRRIHHEANEQISAGNVSLDDCMLRDDMRFRRSSGVAIGQVQEARRDDELERLRFCIQIAHYKLQLVVQLDRGSPLLVRLCPAAPFSEPNFELCT
ncbi:hypothetical protein ACHIPZ_29300 [Antrihabitans sp. NCIMB 15449]|uniref:Uncharacterized protein n=1 Tax=Antrihabitans spumae TaxID=3373370 RepID=A0ABW7JW73_9NOCA